MCKLATVFALCLHFLTCLVGRGLRSYYTCTYVVFRAQYGGTALILKRRYSPTSSSNLHRCENLKYWHVLMCHLNNTDTLAHTVCIYSLLYRVFLIAVLPDITRTTSLLRSDGRRWTLLYVPISVMSWWISATTSHKICLRYWILCFMAL
jgi:hypothetical protein